jgi:hypothetical protein
MKRSISTFAAVLLASCSCAFALDPALDISQYGHFEWRFRDGFARGVIEDIAQTPDGYLWLGTSFGLLRFDGVKTVPWQPPEGQRLPSNAMVRLLAARDGTLWIGTRSGLASWKDGKLTLYPELAGLVVSATRRWAVSAKGCSPCMRAQKGISGSDWKRGCGDGNPGLRNSILCPIRLMRSKGWRMPRMARCWSQRPVLFCGLPMENPKLHIPSRQVCGKPAAAAFSATATAVCGWQRWVEASFIFIKGVPMCFRNRMG